MLNLQTATQTYRANQINGASPLDLSIMAYDAALASCGQSAILIGGYTDGTYKTHRRNFERR
jgi:flagellin-specific chaperone FliS